MTLEPDENRLPSAQGLRFLDLDFRIEAPCSDDLLWLEEFLGPAFTATSDPRRPVDVVLRLDRERVDGWLAQGPLDHRDVVAFRLDQRVVRLPLWRTDDRAERLAWDKRSSAFYRVLPALRRVEVWCRESGKKARRALMRAVREVAIDHAAWSHGLLLHASCLDSGAGAIAFAGPKGCGKTTLLIAALSATASAFLANDRVFVDLSRDPPRVVSLPSIVSLRASSVRHFPDLARRLEAKRWSPWLRWQDLPDQPAVTLAAGEHQGLSPFQFQRWLDCPWTAEAPLRLLALPRVEPGCAEPRIRRLSIAEVEQCLPSLLFAGGRGETSELFALDSSERASTGKANSSFLAARVPVVELTLPTNRVDAATWFDELMRHAAGAVLP